MRHLLVAMVLATAAWSQAFEWPTSPCTLHVKGWDVSCSFRDGKLWADRSQLGPPLNLPVEGEPAVDVAAALDSLHYIVSRLPNGDLQAKPTVVHKGMTAEQGKAHDLAEKERAAYKLPELPVVPIDISNKWQLYNVLEAIVSQPDVSAKYAPYAQLRAQEIATIQQGSDTKALLAASKMVHDYARMWSPGTPFTGSESHRQDFLKYLGDIKSLMRTTDRLEGR